MTIRTHQFANGFRVASEAMPALKTVSIGIWIKAGARHETKSETGIAHFLEHMAFKGTKGRTSLEIAQEIENVGGYINAYTSREITNYYCRVLSQDLPLALDVIADIVLNSTLENHDIDLERNVILQEIGQSLDTPDEIIFDWLQETAYPNQPYGRSILGPAKNVKLFSRKDLKKFTGLHYVPNNMILCAAGEVDHEKLLMLSEKYFGQLAAGDLGAVVKGKFVGGERREYKDLEQTHFGISFEGPAIKHKDLFVGQIYSVLMGGGMSSKLFQEIREKRGLCYSIFSSLEAAFDTGSLTFYSCTSPDKISELALTLINEIRESIDSISIVDLEKSRAQIKAGLLMGLESSSNRCERMVRTLAVWDRIVPLEETIEKINAVSLDDLQRFAKQLCDSKSPAMISYGRIKNAPKLENLLENLSL